MVNHLGEGAWCGDAVIDRVQCQQWIQWSEACGYEVAGFGAEKSRVSAVRNNDRLIEDNAQRADALWLEIQHIVPEAWWRVHMMRRGAIGWFELVGLNPRFRWYRYGVGQRFYPHVDSMVVTEDGLVSFVTVLIYLSDQLLGGQTRVETRDGVSHVVAPQAGRVLCFDHQLMHEGMPIDRGVKYVLRTDLLYRKVG